MTQCYRRSPPYSNAEAIASFMTVFGGKIFKEVFKVKEGNKNGALANRTSVK